MQKDSLGAFDYLPLGSYFLSGTEIFSDHSHTDCSTVGDLRVKLWTTRKEVFAMAKVRVTVKVAVKTTVKRRIIVRR